MSDRPTRPAAARVLSTRWPGWIWAVPLAALGVVIWLGVRAYLDSGPQVTVTFAKPGDVQAGQTKVKVNDVDVGTVESVKLDKDLSHVVLRLRFDSTIAGNLGPKTRFWMVKPQLSADSLASLSTLISGPYVAMDPHPGTAQQDFTGLDRPPTVPPGEAGTSFLLHAHALGAIGSGSALTYRGIQAGKVQTYDLVENGRSVDIHAFVKAPYDKLVREGSRFWNSSGVQISTGSNGLDAQLSSIQALLMGGVDFDTPDALADSPAAKEGRGYTLYESKSEAMLQPTGPQVLYRVRFSGAPAGIGKNTPVELVGHTVGEVTDSHLDYDAGDGDLATLATIAIEPGRIESAGVSLPSGNGRAGLDQFLTSLLGKGLRAQASSSIPIVGGKIVALDFVQNAGTAELTPGNPYPEIPSSAATGIDALAASANSVLAQITAMQLPQIGQSVRRVADHLDALTGSPEITQALQRLDQTLGEAEQIAADLQKNIDPLVRSLRQAASQAEQAVASANALIGGGNKENHDLPDALHELTDTARSVRALADYLDRHPEALLRGRGAQE